MTIQVKVDVHAESVHEACRAVNLEVPAYILHHVAVAREVPGGYSVTPAPTPTAAAQRALLH